MTTAATQHEQRNTTETTLFVAFELSEKTWKLGFTTGHGQKPRERTVPARHHERVLTEIAQAKRRLGLPETALVVSCYEPMVLVSYKPMNTIVLVGLLVMVRHFLHAGNKCATLRGTEEPMTTTSEFITALFCQVDDQLSGFPTHPEAHLWPSEVGTLGLLHALKGVGNRPFYRWLTRDYRPLFPQLPERTRLFRLLTTHQDWTRAFLAAPTVLGGIDTYGIELIHPMREGRSPQQIGRKGLSNHRWIVGGKLYLLVQVPIEKGRKNWQCGG